jgi:hypothetical protein
MTQRLLISSSKYKAARLIGINFGGLDGRSGFAKCDSAQTRDQIACTLHKLFTMNPPFLFTVA